MVILSRYWLFKSAFIIISSIVFVITSRRNVLWKW